MSKHIAYLDYLRLLATFGVIAIHVTLSFTHFNTDEIDTRWQVVNITESFIRWSVPIFVMISGVSFLCLKEEVPIKVLYRKYIFRLALVFVCWNMLYFLCAVGAAYLRGDELPPLAKLMEPYGHLWFLPMMIGVYVVMPFLKVIFERSGGGYFVLLWALYVTVTGVFGKSILSPFMFNLCVGYPGYFVLGGYLHTFEKRGLTSSLVWMGVFLVSCTMIAVLTNSLAATTPRTRFYDYLTPLVVLSSVAVFMMIQGLQNATWLKRVLDIVLKYTRRDLFGIFLIHMFWIDIIPHIGALDILVHRNVHIGIPLLTILIFMISVFTTKIIRLIPVINKLV